jgi:hypothetical protein
MGTRTLRCGNEACRDWGIGRDVFVGEWFVDDAVLCPLCGELLEGTVPVVTGPGPLIYPIAPAWFPGGGRGRPPRFPHK